MKRLLLFGGALTAIIVAFVALGPTRVGAQFDSGLVDIVAGEQIYATNCASCHGANLEGEDDWRSPNADGQLPAPPHDVTGHTWHHSDNVLFDYTALGGREALARQGVDFESNMPGFAEILSEQEIHDVLAFIKSTWSERERAVQAARSSQQ